MKKAITYGGEIIVGVPSCWIRPSAKEHLTMGYDKLPDKVHIADGWKKVIEPPISPSQKMGEIYEREYDFTYHITDKTYEELKIQVLNGSELKRQSIIDNAIHIHNENTIIAVFDAITDPSELLDNLDVFPLWEANTFYKKDRKVKQFTNQELKLYKVGQDHTSLSIYPPDAQGVEALYNEVAPPGAIPEWKQPTGAHNSYAIGEKVTYKLQTWESKIAGNTTVPDGDVPYNRFWKPIN